MTRNPGIALAFALSIMVACDGGSGDADDDLGTPDTVVIEDESDLEEAVEETGEAIGEAGKEVGEGAEEVGEAAAEGAEEAGDKIEDAVD